MLKKSSPSKIIFISSIAAQWSNLSVDNLNWPQDERADGAVYANSKLCCMIAADELSKRLRGTDVTAYAVHPGMIDTKILSGYVHPSLVLDIIQGLIYKIFVKPFTRVSLVFNIVINKLKELV